MVQGLGNIIIASNKMQKTSYSVGPKFFGTTKRKSWFDEGDRCSPGPGTHDPNAPFQTNPPQWGTSKDKASRDSFLDKVKRQYPSPDRYKVTNLDKTHAAAPNFSVPEYEPKENPNKVDEGSNCDYKPRHHFNREKCPDYSFGYNFSRDYSSDVPPPNQYNPQSSRTKHFNKAQRSFSVRERPPPFGEEGSYPYVGKYQVGSDMGGTKYSIGRTDRPDVRVGAGSEQIYNIGGSLLKTGRGKTIGLMIEVPKNKDQEDFPSPDHYNPTLPKTDRNIISYRSKRQQLKNPGVDINPSPEKYQPRLNSKQQTVSFTKQTRNNPDPEPNPGVGSYQVEKPLDTTLGHMASKLKEMTRFENPSPSAYDPKNSLTKPQPQRPINYDSQRTDFSKSITGKNVGPGVYQIEKQDPSALGKIGKSDKFEPNKNKIPGPGSYDIGGGIGKLPKYCNGPKKLTDTGFSCIQLQRQERMRSERAKHDAKAKAQQQELERRLVEQQALQQAKT